MDQQAVITLIALMATETLALHTVAANVYFMQQWVVITAGKALSHSRF